MTLKRYLSLIGLILAILLCALSLPKSLNVATTFPAKQRSRTQSIKEIHISRSELSIAAMGILSLFGAALVEAF